MLFKIFSKGLVSQKMAGTNTHKQVSNPTRYGGLASNTFRLIEETEELFQKA